MPVTDSYKPEHEQALIEKVKANQPGEEGQLVADVTSHVSDGLKYRGIFANYKQLKEKGSGRYRQSPLGETDVTLTAEKCVIFLIRGKFSVDGKDLSERGVAYVVEKERTMQLKKGAVVVILDVI